MMLKANEFFRFDKTLLGLPKKTNFKNYKHTLEMAKQHPTPHDRLFRTTFSHRSEVIFFIKFSFPEAIWKRFDFRTLKPHPASFVDDKMKSHYSDVNYTCKWKGSDGVVLLSFVFEHKSFFVRFPEFQLLRYVLEGYDFQLKQEEE